MNQKFVVITEGNFSQPMSREEAVKTVKEYDQKDIIAYVVSEEEANRIKTPDNFNEPKWK